MQKPKLIWLNVLVFSITALITLIGVPLYAWMYGFDSWHVLAMLAGIIFCEISITTGYHRLWSHRAFEAHWLVRIILMIGGTFAIQNSILHWSSDHRRHHRYVDDNDRDPYSAKRGFWYSHIGWMLRDYDVETDPTYSNCPDLKRDKIVMFQHRHYLPLVLLTNFGIPLAVGLWHGDWVGMLLLLGFARLVISHHMTFFINSLAHIWGSQPYNDQNTAKDNSLIAFLTMGEGYHNYHHAFQRDFRNGIRWWQFDPTKWLILALSWFKLTKNLYRTPVERIEASRAQMMLTRTRRKIQQLPNAEEFLIRLQEEYEILMEKIEAFSQSQKQWLDAKKDAVKAGYDLKALKQQTESLRAAFLQQKKHWLLLNARLA